MKVLRGIATIIGFIIGFIGLCICSCEAPTLDKQVINLFIGFGMMLTGVIITWFCKEEEEYGTY